MLNLLNESQNLIRKEKEPKSDVLPDSGHCICVASCDSYIPVILGSINNKLSLPPSLSHSALPISALSHEPDDR